MFLKIKPKVPKSNKAIQKCPCHSSSRKIFISEPWGNCHPLLSPKGLLWDLPCSAQFSQFLSLTVEGLGMPQLPCSWLGHWDVPWPWGLALLALWPASYTALWCIGRSELINDLQWVSQVPSERSALGGSAKTALGILISSKYSQFEKKKKKKEYEFCILF